MKLQNLTKAQLIDHGRANGVDLSINMLKAVMIERIEKYSVIPKVESIKEEPKIELPKSFQKEEFLIVEEGFSICGCGYVGKGTIVKAIDDEKPNGFVKINYFLGSSWEMVKSSKLRRPTKEELPNVERKFNASNNWNYASV